MARRLTHPTNNHGPEDDPMGLHGESSTRSQFLRAAGLGALGTAAAGALIGGAGSGFLAPNADARRRHRHHHHKNHTATKASTPTKQAAVVKMEAAVNRTIALAATDGYITMPGRADDPVYIFGFVPVTPGASVADLMATYKGHAQHTAPILGFDQNDVVQVTLTNLGLIQRPDLVDSHTIHWHGFDIPSPLYDGVPEVSVAVPISKSVNYLYNPHREGTYMYHCHFEDVEHVQMGMTSIVYVNPDQNRTGAGAGVPIARMKGGAASAPLGYAYNDGDGSTAFDRHFAILLNEIWSPQHDGDRDIQETIPTSFDPDWFTLNGRVYPQTVLLNDDPFITPTWSPASTFQKSGTTSGLTTLNPNTGTLDRSQPNSALMQVNGGDRVLLRLANLGYTQDAMELPGITMHVIGQDASLLRNSDSTDTSYFTNTIYMGPGEARDVLFTAPGYDAARPSGTDSWGDYNVYHFRNRDWRKLSNGGAAGQGDGTAGAGGMQTEVRVYAPARPLPLQTVVGQTYAS
jgi:FtsP/CotA-like multicopper oxidase with cupredoxin domain